MRGEEWWKSFVSEFQAIKSDGENTTAECTAVYRRQQVDTNNRKVVYETVHFDRNILG